MNVNEFIGKMSSTYRDVSDNDAFNLKRWINDFGLTDKNLDDLYCYIAMQYENKTFPPLGKIVKIWNQTGTTIKDKFRYNDFQNRAIDAGRDMSVREISDRVDSIRNQETCKNSEIDFIDVWSDLGTVYGILRDKSMDIDRSMAYCHGLKKSIIAGNRISVEKSVLSFCGNIEKNIFNPGQQMIKQVSD